MMSRMAILLGVPNENITLETKSSNTHEEALFLKDLLQNQEFLLVTSARHMPRSIALFKNQGMRPIPAPTNHLSREDKGFDVEKLIPRAKYLRHTAHAFYEYFGLAKEKLLGRI